MRYRIKNENGMDTEYAARPMIVVLRTSGPLTVPIGNFNSQEELEDFFTALGLEWEVVE